MGVSGGPNVVTDGLVLDLDAANAQSYPNYYNLLRYSQQFNSWTQDSCTVGADAITAPDGTLTADSFTELAVNAQHLATQNISWISGSTYTFSTYAKAGNQNTLCLVMSYTAFGAAWRTAYFDLSAGTVSSNNNNSGVSPTITSVGNGWYRCTFTCTCTTSAVDKLAAGKDFYGHLGDGQINLYLWGAQLELGTQASPYQQIDASYTTKWSDLSPTLISGSLINGAYYNIYPVTKKMTFDGTDDYVAIPYNSSLVTNNISVNVWCYPKVIGQNKTLFTSEPNASPLNGYGFRQRSDNVWWWVVGYAGSGDAVSSSLSQNTWTNLVGTYNGSTITLYKNGVLQASGSSTRTINFTNGLRLGAFTGNTEYFNGDAAFLQIYNRSLSAAEVLQNYNAIKGRFGL
jgi:hypothetical protein